MYFSLVFTISALLMFHVFILFLLSLLLLSEVLGSKCRPIKARPQSERYLDPNSQVSSRRVLSALRRMLLLLLLLLLILLSLFIIITNSANGIFVTISITIQSLYF